MPREKGANRKKATCHPDRPNYSHGTCRQCYQAVYMPKYREVNRERINRHVREYSSIKNLYGMTKEEYDSLVDKQGGRCAICKNPFLSHSHYRGTRIDHIHGTKTVRGILCHGCNLLVGYLEKRRDHLPIAFAYIYNGGVK